MIHQEEVDLNIDIPTAIVVAVVILAAVVIIGWIGKAMGSKKQETQETHAQKECASCGWAGRVSLYHKKCPNCGADIV